MDIIPAIDLLGGKVVRLYKGRKDDNKIYSHDPLKVAQKWYNQGAKLIHLVDLDAAFGEGDNYRWIKEIADSGLPIEVGGGLRDLETVEHYLKIGIKRVVIGSKAVDDAFLSKVIKRFGRKVAVGVDVKNDKVMIKGWQDSGGYSKQEFIKYLASKGVSWIIYTDISRDGTLSGLNYHGIKELADFKGLNFIASGGVSSLEDIEKINRDFSFIKGVIVGKALYQGRLKIDNFNFLEDQLKDGEGLK
jgi:phosphoribosylformimino-5-aminoimidazole carboxamide ribotide isomerase